MTDLTGLLRSYWKHQAFRPLQEEIIRSVLAKQDTLALLPTGGGKSLCYQLPTLAMDGLCLVISPLIALMKDQVESLRRKNITAFAIYSGMSRKELIHTFEVASRSNCKFLYVSPERLETTLFKEYLPALSVCLIAVDEAHCVSQWGYDFRPPYLRIAALREELPGVPVLALTASATPAVQTDIADKLKLHNPQIFRQAFTRKNLSFSAFRVDTKINKLLEILQNVPGSSIIYCRSRGRCRHLAELLQMQGIPATYYHAGLIPEERNQKQEDWIANRVRVMVCTNAFGMGIDKPDVRTVIHADIPDCLENYYQEAGRAGRDEQRAYAVLLYNETDLHELRDMPDERFPPPETIRKIFTALVNHLQLPAGNGEQEYFNFDLRQFTEQYGFDFATVQHVLKTLEQEGWVSFNDKLFLPATLGFLTGRAGLESFERSRPELDTLIKTLLRTYAGILDQEVPIREKTLARLLKRPVGELEKDLHILHQLRIVNYAPVKEGAQLYFLRPRPVMSDFQIDQKKYAARKKQWVSRVAAMIHYAQEGKNCRSRILANYFGDESAEDCGICDNCLRRKRKPISQEEFEFVHARIRSGLQEGALTPEALLRSCRGVSKEKVWTVIEFLQSENKLTIDRDGLIAVP